MDSSLLELAVSSVGFLLTVMLTTAFSGMIVSMGKGYGKIYPSKDFQPVEMLFWVFLGEAILLSIVFGYLEPFMDRVLWRYWEWLPTVVTEAFVLYYVWFCLAFGFNPRWKALVYPQAIPILNWVTAILVEMFGRF